MIIADTKESLQRTAYKLHLTAKDYNLTITITKNKTMYYKDSEPIIYKIVIEY